MGTKKMNERKDRNFADVINEMPSEPKIATINEYPGGLFTYSMNWKFAFGPVLAPIPCIIVFAIFKSIYVASPKKGGLPKKNK